MEALSIVFLPFLFYFRTATDKNSLLIIIVSNSITSDVFTEREKLKGNEFYRVGEVEEAVKCYSRSIDLDPRNHILYANRAMGYLKLEAYEKAEEDCTKALVIDCTYVKAWSRRGLTRFKRGQYAAVKTHFSLLYFPYFSSLFFLTYHFCRHPRIYISWKIPLLL